MNWARLIAQIQAQASGSVSINANPSKASTAGFFFQTWTHPNGTVIGLDTTTPLTPAQQTAIANIIAAYDPTPTADELLAVLALHPALIALLAFRLSASWATATAKQQSHAQAIFDTIGTKVAGILPA